MTITIELPDDLAASLTALLPEEDRKRFAVAAIADALETWQKEDPECVAAVEKAVWLAGNESGGMSGSLRR